MTDRNESDGEQVAALGNMIAYIKHELKNLCQANIYTDLTYVDNYFTHISGYSVTIQLLHIYFI